MKQVLAFLTLVSVVLCSYLDGLDRSFKETEGKIVDFYFTMPESEVNKLIELTQISYNQVSNGQADSLPDFETDTASLVVKFNGDEKTFDGVNFKTGGMFARANSKVGYNIKIKDKLFGRKQLRFRPDPNDRTFMRQKITCDIANRMGLPSIQSAYSRLYINGKFWGLYILMDAIKTSWVKQNFNVSEEEVSTLFQCKKDGMDLTPSTASLCINANDKVTDTSEFQSFVNQVNSAQTIEELEKIMDVDVFLKYMAFEWLIGSFDNFLVLGHNFYFYKRESDNKWVIIEYDFDNTFGMSLQFASYWMKKGLWNIDVIKASFSTWDMDHKIIKILVNDNPERFKNIVKEALVSALTPDVINKHIDELKTFLYPYVKEDLTVGSDGNLPGRINKVGSQSTFKNISEFEANIESMVDRVHGLKQWISLKFDTAISEYSFNKSEIVSEALKYTPKSYDYGKSSSGQQPASECWSMGAGYPCCTGCNVIYSDNEGEWGIENNDWCGISKDKCTSSATKQCHSEGTEFPCCNSCTVYYSDESGDWGVENGNWCGIKNSC